MVTVQQVYDMAIHLMDEQSESNGATETTDTAEYKYRTISILNTIIPELYQYSSGNTSTKAHAVPMMLDNDSYASPDFEQTIPLDDALGYGVLPYYLASQLLITENESLAQWFYSRYTELFADLRRNYKADWEQISTPYGLF